MFYKEDDGCFSSCPAGAPVPYYNSYEGLVIHCKLCLALTSWLNSETCISRQFGYRLDCMMAGKGNEEQSDEDLMLGYQQGDAAAFEVLYGRHKGGVFRYLLAKCHQQAIAEELFQDVWMKLIAARDRYEVRARFTTYLYQLAHNHFIDYYRKTRTDVFQRKDCDEDVEQITVDYQKQADEQLEIQRQTEKLSELVDNLPDDQREAFMLREEAGLTVAEIAVVTGVNAEAAKSRLRYAVKKLRAGLRENG